MSKRLRNSEVCADCSSSGEYIPVLEIFNKNLTCTGQQGDITELIDRLITFKYKIYVLYANLHSVLDV